MTAARRACGLGLAALLGACGSAAADTPQSLALNAGFLALAPAPPTPAAVCVVDSGVEPAPEVAGSLTARLNALGLPAVGDADPALHGTLVADVIAGRQVGVWPWAQIVSVRVWPADSPQPFWRGYLAGIYLCIKHAGPVRVINLSLSDQPVDPIAALKLAQGVADARAHGISVVVSAGNNAGAPPHTPADTPGVLAVAAADPAGGLCAYSAQAPGILAAPACPTVSVSVPDGVVRSVDGGTSLAAPQVSAVLAALRAYRPDLGRQAAEDLLRATARHGPSQALLVDADAAFRAAGLAALLPPAPAPVTAPVPVAAPPPPVPAAAGTPAPPARPLQARLPRPVVRRSVRYPRALAVELRRPPPGARPTWGGGARGRTQGRLRVVFRLGERPRRVWLRFVASERTASTRVFIHLPARRA